MSYESSEGSDMSLLKVVILVFNLYQAYFIIQSEPKILRLV